ncbi:MAG TPA: protein kinase [Trebonia sp.]
MVVDPGITAGGGLVAEYGALREEPSGREHARKLAALLVRLLSGAAIGAAVRDDGPMVSVVFRHGGRPYAIGLARSSEQDRPAGEEFVAWTRLAAPGASVVVLSIPGFTGPEVAETAGTDCGGTVLWDRTHFEAVLCGLVSFADLLDASINAAFFRNAPHETLARLLADSGPDRGPGDRAPGDHRPGERASGHPVPVPDGDLPSGHFSLTGAFGDGDDLPARMLTPDQLPPLWPLQDTGREAAPGPPAWLALVGEEGWDRPCGIAAARDGHLIVVTSGGVVDLDPVRGMTSWLTRLPGCVNGPLVLPDDSVLVVRGGAIARVSGDHLEAVAGGFDDDARLLPGPDGDPWVLSGPLPDAPGAYGTDPALPGPTLTRLGLRAGDQHHYCIDYDAPVTGAVWLDGLRFFLTGPANAAVVDLSRSTRVTDADRVPAPWAHRQFPLVLSPGEVLTATGDPAAASFGAEPGGPGADGPDAGPGSEPAGVTVFRTDLRRGVAEPAGTLRLTSAAGLCATADGTGYLLGDMSPAGPPGAWPVLVRLPGLLAGPGFDGNAARAGAGAGAGFVGAARARVPAPTSALDDFADPWDPVRMMARGRDQDYDLDPQPIDRGGQAEVFGARHLPSGLRVALKRLRSRSSHTAARMRREIEAAQTLGGNQNLMPVLDYGGNYDWFVMPLADHSAAAALPELSQTAGLRRLVTAICDALRDAHTIGWIHRDLKPANLLWLRGNWTVADWGLARRPLGETTYAGRTRTGGAFGSIGFAAPELFPDPHSAGPAADIYSIGQIIGWVVTGQIPQANTPLIPSAGPWRQVVRAATQRDPALRPPTVDALLDLVAEELDYEQPDEGHQVRLSAAANGGDGKAAVDLFALAARQPQSIRLYTEMLPALTREAVVAAVDADPGEAIEIARAMAGRVRDSHLAVGDAARIITMLHWIQARAARNDFLSLLEDAARAVFAWDQHWNLPEPRREISAWLPLLSGDHAAAVARELRECPGSARHFGGALNDDRTDDRLRRAISAALRLGAAADPGGASGAAGVPGDAEAPEAPGGIVARVPAAAPPADPAPAGAGPTDAGPANAVPADAVPADAVPIGPTFVPAGPAVTVAQGIPRLPAHPPRRAALPAELSSFVGREEELQRLATLLSTARAVTVTGPGGIGKSRLALRSAMEAAPRFRDGVRLIQVPEAADPSRLAGLVANSLGLPDQYEGAGLRDVIGYLRTRELMLVLDTCDQMLGACADLAEAIIRDTDGITLLMTSRQPLGVPGEHCLRLPPLPVPAPFGSPAKGDAVDLFEQRAAAATSGFTVTAANAADVIRLCRRLDGVPLAIEMAATKLRALPLSELADRMDRKFDVLARINSPVPRHRSLRTTAQWTYEQCTPAERTLWQRLSVFTDTFDLTAAEQVCTDSSLDADTMTDVLVALADKSVVAFQETADSGRYRLPDAYRNLGAEQLEASGEAGEFQARHFACYDGLAREFADNFLGPDGLILLRELRGEHLNIQAALERALTGPAGQPAVTGQPVVTGQAALDGQPTLSGHVSPTGELAPRPTTVSLADAVGLIVSLADFWHTEGQLQQGRYWISQALGRCEGPSRERALALIIDGYLATAGGNARDAAGQIREGIEMAAALGEEEVCARGYLHLTQALTYSARYPEAAAAGAGADRRLSALGDQAGLFRLQPDLGLIDVLSGSAQQAAARCEAALRESPHGANWIRGYLYTVLAFAQLRMPGREAECADSARRSLRVHQEIGNRIGMAHALELLGWLAALSNRHKRSAWLLGAANSLWDAAGSRLCNVPRLQELHNSAETTARAALSQRQFSGIQAMAADSPLNEVIAFAIGDVSIQVITPAG